MHKDTILLRQIFPDWFKDGVVSSQAFNPTEEHEFMLSSYSGESFDGISSFEHYTKDLQMQSTGCLGVTNEEYLNHGLVSTKDDLNFNGHVSTDFSKHGSNQRAKKAKLLRNIAFERNWVFKNNVSNDGVGKNDQE